MDSAKLVVGVTGMAGAGKSIIVKIAAQKGYEIVVMGDEVREEAKRRSLMPTPESLGKIMLELRQAHGETVIAKRCIAKIEKTQKMKIVIDGIRSLSEAEEFKNSFSTFSLIAIHSSPETRFRRLYNRQRSDDSRNWQVFRERDLRELSVGLGNAIAMAEYMVVNEGTLEFVKAQAHEILKKVESKWMK